MSKRCLPVLFLAALFALDGGGYAQDSSTSKNKRIVYVVKRGDAKELANLLAKHFKGDAEIQVLPDSPSNCLLISAAPNVFEEVIKALERLDQPPRLIAVELLVAEVLPKKGEDGKPAARELDEKELTGSSQEVLKKLEALKKDGAIGTLKRIQLTTVENQPASAMIGETKPMMSGPNTIHYRNVGTNARVTAQVSGENTVQVELNVEDARLFVPPDGIELGKDEKGAPILATEVVLASLKTKVSVPSGQAVPAIGVKTTSKSGQTQTLVVVTARVLKEGK
jgi:type II secretory pathway component GspD/PulD (secretin)